MTVAHLEEVLERRPEEVDDHDVVFSLFARVEDPRDSWTAHEALVYLRFVSERAVFRNCGLDFDGDLLAGDVVDAIKDGSCDEGWRSEKLVRGGADGEENDKPQPPTASSSSSLYFPPKVKSMLEREEEEEEEALEERLRGGMGGRRTDCVENWMGLI